MSIDSYNQTISPEAGPEYGAISHLDFPVPDNHNFTQEGGYGLHGLTEEEYLEVLARRLAVETRIAGVHFSALEKSSVFDESARVVIESLAASYKSRNKWEEEARNIHGEDPDRSAAFQIMVSNALSELLNPKNPKL